MGKPTLKCPSCDSKNVIRKGTALLKYSTSQVYLCKDCGKKFREQRLANKTYRPKVITAALTHYNLGHTIAETVRYTNRRFKVKVSPSSVHSWIREFSDICAYHRVRDRVIRKFGRDIIVSREFDHHGLNYNFRYHRGKLDLLPAKFNALKTYVRSFENGCPDYYKDDERPSQLKIDLKIERGTKFNQACRLAALALTAKRTNYERHTLVENFMLINDSTTVACEVPVWFWEKNLDAGIFGHIDVLQVRYDRIYVMDYKPGAKRENVQKVASQLFFYASGLSFRTKIPLEKFSCAWFDDEVYYEFSPRESTIKYRQEV
jgi:transposase-like protein